jgi:hypothetical protein
MGVVADQTVGDRLRDARLQLDENVTGDRFQSTFLGCVPNGVITSAWSRVRSYSGTPSTTLRCTSV